MSENTTKARAAARRMGSGIKRNVLPRLQFICQRIWEADKRRANRRTLSEEWEVSGKCIARDIELLRDQFGHRIEYDRHCFTFRYLAPPPPLFWISPRRRDSAVQLP